MCKIIYFLVLLFFLWVITPSPIQADPFQAVINEYCNISEKLPLNEQSRRVNQIARDIASWPTDTKRMFLTELIQARNDVIEMRKDFDNRNIVSKFVFGLAYTIGYDQSYNYLRKKHNSILSKIITQGIFIPESCFIKNF